jgi:Tfp pilus assembly protein PilO
MKKKFKDAYITIVILLIILLPIVHINYVIHLAKEQGEVRKLKKSVNEYEELYQSKKISFENKVDLERIEKEAKTKLKMEVSNEIEYFKLK